MTTIFFQAFEVLSRLLFALRSACSLRRIAALLPAGKAAPRVNIQWSTEHLSGFWQYRSADTTSATDEFYTSTTCVSDFEGMSAPCYVTRPVNSNHIRGHLPSDEIVATKPIPRNYGERRQPECGSGDVNLTHSRVCRARSQGSSGHFASQSASPTMPFGASITIHSKLRSRRKRAKNFPQDKCAKDFHGYTHSSVRSFSMFSGISHKAVSVKFSNLQPACSGQTSENGRSSSFDSDAELDSSQRQLCDTKRIRQLEMEMYQLRSQLSRLLIAQEGRQLLIASSDEFDQRLEGDGESDAGPVDLRDSGLSNPAVSVDSETSDALPVQVVPSSSTLPPPPPPPPLPPPPPPPSPATQLDWRAKLLATKRKKYETGSDGSSQKAQNSLKAADMGQVLRELQSGMIKLRSVPRSPGGTPVRSHQSPKINEVDPCSIIARALKNKFGNARAVLNVSSSGGENTQCSSFCESPQTNDLRLSSVNRTDDVAPFGPHLLRPSGRTNRDII